MRIDLQHPRRRSLDLTGLSVSQQDGLSGWNRQEDRD